MYNAPLLPGQNARLEDINLVSDPDLVKKSVRDHETLVACYPIFDPVDEKRVESILTVGLEVAFGGEVMGGTSQTTKNLSIAKPDGACAWSTLLLQTMFNTLRLKL